MLLALLPLRWETGLMRGCSNFILLVCKKAYLPSAVHPIIAHLCTIPCGVHPVLEDIMCIRALFSSGAEIRVFHVDTGDRGILALARIPSSRFFSRVREGASCPIVTESLAARHNLERVNTKVVRQISRGVQLAVSFLFRRQAGRHFASGFQQGVFLVEVHLCHKNICTDLLLSFTIRVPSTHCL